MLYFKWGKCMSQTKLMTMEEEVDIARKALALKKQGKFDEYEQTMKQIPLPAYLAKIAKKYFGADTLLKTGWNLAEAEAEFGPGWLSK